jgi:hypothetical protein
MSIHVYILITLLFVRLLYMQVQPLLDRVSALIKHSIEEGNLFDRPNGHTFIELAKRQLPYLRNCVFARTNLDERHHRRAKLNGVKKTVDKPRQTMFQYNCVSTMGYLLNGGRFGPEMQYQMAATLRGLLQDGKTHPLILKVCDCRIQ